MMRRRWIIGAVTVSALAIGVIAAVLIAGAADGNCRAVRQFIDYNNEFRQQTGSLTGRESDPTPVDYRGWANRLHLLADDIEDQDLAPHALSAAELADQYAALVTYSPNDDGANADLTPQEVEDLFALNQRFGSEMLILHEACPA